MSYRYQHFHTKLLMDDMRFHAGPEPGQPMPDFHLPTTDGRQVTKGEFVGRRWARSPAR